MSNSFPAIPETTPIRDSLDSLLARDKAALSCYSGENDPPSSSLSEDMIGMIYVNTSTKEVKQLETFVGGVATWKVLLDFSSRIPNQEEIASTYQPLSSALTKLSTLTPSANSIPYFTSDGAATIPTQVWARNFVASDSPASARTALGIGTIGTKDVIQNEDIADNTITISKLNPNIHIDSAGYDLGDMMETTAVKTLEDGWCPLCFDNESNPTFGNAGSGATVSDSSLQALYQLLYANPNLALYTQDGQAASKTITWDEAWDGLYRLQLPQVNGRIVVCGTSSDLCETTSYSVYASESDSSLNFVSMKAYIRTK